MVLANDPPQRNNKLNRLIIMNTIVANKLEEKLGERESATTNQPKHVEGGDLGPGVH